MRIKAAGFDLDGTLYPAWMMYGASLDLGLRHPRIFSAYARARSILHAQESSAAGSPGIPKDFRARQAALVGNILGMETEAAARAIDSLIYGAVEKRFSRVSPFRGVPACLEALRAGGLRLGVLSDLPPAAKLESLGLSAHFSCALCSEESGALKPDPAPFLDLSARLGVLPGEMVYVGNKYYLDCAGAKAAGMRTALLGPPSGPYADFSFRRWSELLSWIQGQN